MRSFISALLISFVLLSPPIKASQDAQRQLNTVEEVLQEPNGAVGATSSEVLPPPSTFNGIEVPPMKELNGTEFEKETKDGYWFVKHYSPYCHHCIAIAPVWQTLYEFYYTSKTAAESSKTSTSQTSLNSFHRYYDFNFASLDCIAFGDTCSSHDVEAFPTFSLYKDAKFVKKFEGHKDMNGFSSFIEDVLESIRPGSRPKNGVTLPEVGANSVQGDTADTLTEKETYAAGSKARSSKGSNLESTPGENLTATENKVAPKSKSTGAKITNKPLKPTATPNPVGTSVPLSQEDFQKRVTNTQDDWFIKFYAPWCHHCQALAPTWLQMSKELRGKLNVGEVNCDYEVRLCKDVRIKSYPTVYYFRGGERVEYDGLTGLGDLVSFAKKALDIGSGVKYVDASAFKELEETEEVIFLYFYDHATTSEDFEALERLTLSLIGHAKLVKTDSALLADRFKISTWPRLLVSRDGRPSYYNALSPRDMRDFRQVLTWMQSVWLPIVPELTASNSKEIMHGKFVVLGVLSRERANEFVSAKREIKNAALEWMEKQTHAFQLERQELRDAKQNRLEEAEDKGDQRALRAAKSIQVDITEEDRKQVGFAWVDGVFWERWIRSTYGVEVANGERVIINDEDNHRYWDVTESGAPLIPSRTSILETLPKVVSNPPKIGAKSSSGALQQVFFQARGASTSHPFLAMLIIASCVGAAVWGKGIIRRTRGGGFFQLDGKEGLLNGGSAYGKAD